MVAAVARLGVRLLRMEAEEELEGVGGWLMVGGFGTE